MKSKKKSFLTFISGITISGLCLYIFGNNYPIISWFGVIITFSLVLLQVIIDGREGNGK